MKQRGFALIEVIVAFALMAMVLTLCLSVASRSYRQVHWSDANARAVLWAQTLSDEASAQPLTPGVQQGESPDRFFRWRRVIATWKDPAGTVIARGQGTGLLEMRIEVKWIDGDVERTFATRTLRRPSSTATSPLAAP